MEGVSTTAELCSFARAHHSLHADRKIFDDYLAIDLMGSDSYHDMEDLVATQGCAVCPVAEEGQQAVCPWLNRYIAPILLSRAAFAERALQTFAEEHELVQYVVCGAGLDTFAFRNGNGGIRVFELDHPLTQQHKLERVNRLRWEVPESANFVPIDFTQQNVGDVLPQAGFCPGIPSFFSIMGVSYYLQLHDFEATVAAAARLMAPGSQLVFDYPDETTLLPNDNSRPWQLAQFTANLGEPMHRGYTFAEVEEALARHGFSVARHLDPARIQTLFFDGRTDGQQAFENVHFIKAEFLG